MQFQVKKTIEERRSVRTFDGKGLSQEDLNALSSYAKNLTNPFNVPVKFQFIEKQTAKGGEKLGTYGVIKGASHYIAVTAPKVDKALEAVGYTFEQLILYATHLGIGTCWLAATFDRKSFGAKLEISDSEMFPAVSPIGYFTEKRSVTEKLFRSKLKADHRKPWNELFFLNDFTTPLDEEHVGEYKEPLEMLRLAPSASNKQPWRILKNELGYHFYKINNGDESSDESLIQKVDVGIGANHFHLTATQNGLNGKFETVAEQQNMEYQEVKYLFSWIPE